MNTISKTIKQLLIVEPFYGVFASGLSRIWSNQVDQMGITPDGLNFKLLINKEYWNSLSENHRLGLLKHNLLHMCFFHVTDFETYKALAGSDNLMQLAMDLEVNSYIYDEWIPNNPATALFTKYPNLPKRKGTKFYIEILKNIINNPEENNEYGLETEGVTAALNAVPMLEHQQWGSGIIPALARTQLEYRLQTVSQSITQIPQELKNIIGGLLTYKKPIFNWKKYLRMFAGNAIDYTPKLTRRRESNRFAGSMGHKLSKKHKILIGIDTSGSINLKELDEFFSEIYHIYKAGAEIDVVEFDTCIHNQYHYKGKAPTHIKGRGGTSFRPFVEYSNNNIKKYSLVLCFTDGESSLHDLHPVGKFCWVITSDGRQQQKYPGYQINIPKILE